MIVMCTIHAGDHKWIFAMIIESNHCDLVQLASSQSLQSIDAIMEILGTLPCRLTVMI